MSKIFPLLFGCLFCAACVWLLLCIRLFRILETRHPRTYESMGRPGLVTNNSFSTNIAFLKFLFGRAWKDLDDPGLEKLAKSMLVFAVMYLLGFVILFLSMPLDFTP